MKFKSEIARTAYEEAREEINQVQKEMMMAATDSSLSPLDCLTGKMSALAQRTEMILAAQKNAAAIDEDHRVKTALIVSIESESESDTRISAKRDSIN